MPAGMQVYNDAGVLQVDGQNRHYVMRQKGSGTCNTSQSSGGRTRYYTLITYTGGTAPVIALGNTAGVSVYHVGVSGSTWTYAIVSNTNGQTFDYFIFDVGPSASGSGQGMQVFREDGALAYEVGGGASAAKPLRVAGAGTGTYASGRTYAALLTSNGFTYSRIDFGLDEPNYQYQAYLAGATVSGNVVESFLMVFESYFTPVGPEETYNTDFFMIVLDVTNY